METVDDLVKRAQKLENQKKYQDAFDSFGKAVDVDDTRLDAHSGLARCSEVLPRTDHPRQAAGFDLGPETGSAIDSTVHRAQMNDQFTVQVRAEQRRLMDELLILRNRGAKKAGRTTPFLSKDEVKLLAGVRVLKNYGAAMSKFTVQDHKFSEFVVESVRTVFSSRS
ncbi:hypothetical protein ACFL2T_01175 [Elusimicrobiota bacterium]